MGPRAFQRSNENNSSVLERWRLINVYDICGGYPTNTASSSNDVHPVMIAHPIDKSDKVTLLDRKVTVWQIIVTRNARIKVGDHKP